MFSLYGLSVAFEGAIDRNKAKLAADRIFDIIDRESAIDPLGENGIREALSIEVPKKAKYVSHAASWSYEC
jgi:hypothetical protein